MMINGYKTIGEPDQQRAKQGLVVAGWIFLRLVEHRTRQQPKPELTYTHILIYVISYFRQNEELELAHKTGSK